MRFRMSSALVLSAKAPRPDLGHPPARAVEAAFTVTGEYRDGPGPGGLCDRRHEVVPKSWLIRDGAVVLTIRNGPPEPFQDLPDGADPMGAGGIQPVEACDRNFQQDGFQMADAGRWG
jgi:hypothetical protein